MDKKFKELLATLDSLPSLKGLGKLNIFQLKILQLIQKNKVMAIKSIISHPDLDSISKAQRYRYIYLLIELRLIKFCCKKELVLV